MSKKTRNVKKKIASNMVSFFVLVLFLFSFYVTLNWTSGVFGSRDSRKIIRTTQFQKRPIDATNDPIQPFRQPIFSVAFDDNWESVYSNAFPVLQKNGILTTQYVITGVFDDNKYMSIAQIRDMQKAGHQIGAHTITHPDLTTLSDVDLTRELVESKEELIEKFGEIQDFTSPYGAYNERTITQISKYYRSQKNAEGDASLDDESKTINVEESFNPLNYKSYSVRNNTKLDDIKKLINALQMNNGWLVLTYHQVDYSNETFSVTPEQFNDQMEYLRTVNVKNATIGQVMDQLYPEQKAGY